MAEKATGTYEQQRMDKRVARGPAAKRHCARFWWAYLIAFIVIALVVVLPIIFVGYPHLAQKEINKGRIEVTNQEFTDPTPDHVHTKLSSILLTNSSQTAHNYGFNASFSLKGSDAVLFYMQLPDYEGRNGSVVNVDQTVTIANKDAFANFSAVVLSSKELTVVLAGKEDVKVGALQKTSVNINSDIQLQGFNNLAGQQVQNLEILNSSLSDGTNTLGNVTIPNPTVLTLAMGDVSFDMSVAGTPIGNLTIPDFYFKPGNHTYEMRATSIQITIAQLLQQPKYNCGKFPVDLKNGKSVYNGTELPYYSKALSAGSLQVPLDLSGALQKAGLGGLITGDCSG